MTEQKVVARERELAQLESFLDQALAGQSSVVFVTGEAGSGKTTLVSEFARRAQGAHGSLLVATGICNAQTGIGDPYLPFRQVLAQLTGDVESRLAQGSITSENAGRLRAFLRTSGEALIDLGPDLIDIIIPGAGLTHASWRLSGGQGRLAGAADGAEGKQSGADRRSQPGAEPPLRAVHPRGSGFGGATAVAVGGG